MRSRVSGAAKAAVFGAIVGFIAGYLACFLVLPAAADAVDRALGCGACAAVAGLVGAVVGSAPARRVSKERGEDECETRSS